MKKPLVGLLRQGVFSVQINPLGVFVGVNRVSVDAVMFVLCVSVY